MTTKTTTETQRRMAEAYERQTEKSIVQIARTFDTHYRIVREALDACGVVVRKQNNQAELRQAWEQGQPLLSISKMFGITPASVRAAVRAGRWERKHRESA